MRLLVQWVLAESGCAPRQTFSLKFHGHFWGREWIRVTCWVLCCPTFYLNPSRFQPIFLIMFLRPVWLLPTLSTSSEFRTFWHWGPMSSRCCHLLPSRWPHGLWLLLWFLWTQAWSSICCLKLVWSLNIVSGFKLHYPFHSHSANHQITSAWCQSWCMLVW